jgi:hypothetical protein
MERPERLGAAADPSVKSIDQIARYTSRAIVEYAE